VPDDNVVCLSRTLPGGIKSLFQHFCVLYGVLTACLYLSSKGAEPVFRNPRVKLLWDRWRNVWMLAWERQRRLQEKYSYLLELEKVKNFSWDDWRKRVSTLIIEGLFKVTN
jgi:hypothetical protein